MSAPPPAKHAVPLSEIVTVFFKIGVGSFGGSTAAMTYREIVENRRWLSETSYLTGLTVAQVLPGANPVNLALYIGLQMRGGLGATAAATGTVAPGFFLILLFGFLYSRFGNTPLVHTLLAGLAAVGIGMTLSVGYRLANKVFRKARSLIITLIIFGTIGVLHWPMIPVTVVMTPLSILLELYLDRRRAHG